MGSFNMRKQQTSGLDFIKYLALQNKHFKLTPTGEILGMDRYKKNARNTQQQFSLPGEDYTQEMSISIPYLTSEEYSSWKQGFTNLARNTGLKSFIDCQVKSGKFICNDGPG